MRLIQRRQVEALTLAALNASHRGLAALVVTLALARDDPRDVQVATQALALTRGKG